MHKMKLPKTEIKWHPELMLEDEFSKKLFKGFIEKSKYKEN